VPCRRVQRVLAVDAVKKRRANKQTVEKTRTQNDRELTSGFRCQLTAPAHEAASSHLTVSSKPKKTVPEKLRGCSIAIVTMFAVSVMVSRFSIHLVCARRGTLILLLLMLHGVVRCGVYSAHSLVWCTACPWSS